jgi:uncharacterized membrane protein YqjE
MVEHTSSGLLASLLRMADTGLSAVKNRVELFSVELREERARFFEALMWASIALFMAMMAIIVLTATIVLFSPPEARPYVTAGFALCYLLGASWAALSLRARLRRGGVPFSETLSQLDKDRACVNSPS